MSLPYFKLAVMGLFFITSGDASVSLICSQNTMKNLALRSRETSMEIRVDTVEYIKGINGHAVEKFPIPTSKTSRSILLVDQPHCRVK